MQRAEIEEIIDLILWGDIHEAPLSLIKDKIDTRKAESLPDEAYTRVAMAATLRQKYQDLPDEKSAQLALVELLTSFK